MMPTDCISFQESGYFSKIMIDYLQQDQALQPFYNRFPLLENFEKQIEEKSSQFTNNQRNTLVNQLKKQYEGFSISQSTQHHISLLEKKNTFTITTGHQLNLFTGPLYFLYKIIATINLCKKLGNTYPEHNFVPIYWMATEDHDFEEINYFTLHGKKIRWNKNTSGPVGKLDTKGLDDIATIFSKEIGPGKNAAYLKELFEKSYLQHDNLADATRFLANELFKEHGLIIIDGEDTELKKALKPIIKNELEQQKSFNAVSKTIEKLHPYTIQVNPREINLFYIEENLRERIIEQNGKFVVNNTSIEFTKNEILKVAENNPEKFSPNVIIRPLYQELILPNLCYIGGGGELAYWLELKEFFNQSNVVFPILLLRNSAIIIEEKQVARAQKLELSVQDLFKKQEDLINEVTQKLSGNPFDFEQQKLFLRNQFDQLLQLVQKTNKSFEGAVKAQEIKQIKGLNHLEKRFLKAEKKRFKEQLEKIIALQNELFPNQSLQERQTNFSEFYAKFGPEMIHKMMTSIQPLETEFDIITL